MASEPPKRNVDVGRVIGRGFEALKANFLPFFGFALLLVGLPGFASTYIAASRINTLDPNLIFTSTYWLTVFGGGLIGFLGTTLLQGVLTRSTILQLGGRDPDVPGSASMRSAWCCRSSGSASASPS